MNISIFNDMTSRLPLPGSLEGVACLIRSDEKLKAFTASYRQTGSKTFKSECQLFAVACIFEGGKGQENIKRLTGLSLVDFDHIFEPHTESPGNNPHTESTDLTESIAPACECHGQSPVRANPCDPCATKKFQYLKDKIIADPHTLMCYTTISGNGLRVIYKYELPREVQAGRQSDASLFTLQTSLYTQAFFAGNAYYERLLGIKADPQCKNITRLSGLAHDPDVFLRPEAEATAFTAGEIAGEAAAYARQSKEDKQLRRIQTYYDTLIAPQLAKDGIRFAPGSHNDYVMRVGYKLAERRFSKKVAIRWAKQLFSAYPDTEQVFTSCFANAAPKGNATGGSGTRDGTKTATVDEIKSFLDAHIKLRYNEITTRIEYLEGEELWLPISDRRVNSLWAEMSTVTRVNKQDIYSIIESDYVPPFNPFKEYFNGLARSHTEPTDLTDKGKHAIQELANSVQVKGGPPEQERWHRYLKKWLVAMVAGWLDTTTVNNVILVLIGEQGAFKTTWFNYILPPPLKQYFYTKTNANRMGRDDLLTLAQYALVCCEELDTMRPAELNQLKAAVTMPSIDERAAYAHYHEHRQHIASFCGTGNNPQFLSDPTGNRRWLPFEVAGIVSPRDHPFDYDAIYAEAYALYRSGFKYWFEKEEIQELNRHNRKFETPHLERELVDLYFRKPGSGKVGEFMSVARALQVISAGISQKLSAVNVGRAFAELGFERVRTRNSRGFVVVSRTPEDMKAYQFAQLHDARSGEEG